MAGIILGSAFGGLILFALGVPAIHCVTGFAVGVSICGLALEWVRK